MKNNINLHYNVNNDDMCITIYDSYKIKSWDEMIAILEYIHSNINGFSLFNIKSVKDMIKEWQAHNLLYELHLFRNHTKDVDLNVENKYRNICYTILSNIYRITHWRVAY